jgi:ABC-type sulfate/molybdate transport systems ATPase subunit
MLVCRFRKQLAEFVLDVDVSVGVETLSLVGRSGAGKSMTLLGIAGLTPLADGSIVLARRTLFDKTHNVNLPPEERRVGYVSQQYALFPHLSVGDNVAFGIASLVRPERAQRVRHALDLVGLPGKERESPRALSGGERQRVALARALVREPDVLLLDEPLAALDVENRARIRVDLRALLARLATPAIVVTHDFDDARVLGDRIAVIHRGRIVQTGTASDLARAPNDQFVASLTGTNVADVSSGNGAVEHIAFDPWDARLSAAPAGGALEWRGEIVDLRPLGAFVRVVLRASSDLRVDVDAAAAQLYHIGDVVYASVPAAAIRREAS